MYPELNGLKFFYNLAMAERLHWETDDVLKRLHQVKNLPIEDTLWLIEEHQDVIGINLKLI